MLKTADYIFDHIIIADEKNTTKAYCKKATGVDVSLREVYRIMSAGEVYRDRTIVADYLKEEPRSYQGKAGVAEGWFLPQGTYIAILNEGFSFGTRDVGYIIPRSSLNRSGVSLQSALWDPSFTTRTPNGDILPGSVRITVDSPTGIFIEKNARIGQLIVWEIEEGAVQYAGQFQYGTLQSHKE